jgi:hypothetical protein
MEKSTTSINQCFYSLLESKDIQGAVTERSPPFSPSASSICCTYKLRTGCQSWHNFVKTIKHPWCSEISEIATGILRKCTTKVSPRLEPPREANFCFIDWYFVRFSLLFPRNLQNLVTDSWNIDSWTFHIVIPSTDFYRSRRFESLKLSASQNNLWPPRGFCCHLWLSAAAVDAEPLLS